jgi:2-succinyl-6-hydroxy-2,4-cyclohexadiene-1-carboxylate synthase
MKLYSDGIRYHLTLHQSKKNLPVLLMMHGFMGSEEAFSHMIEPLRRFCNPLTIDLAGHGKSQTPPDPELFKTRRQVEQLRSVLSRFQFDYLYAYGYSMGGRLLLQLAVRHPELFRGVIIESAHCGIEDDAERKQRTAADEQRAAEIESDFEGFISRWLELPLFEHTPDDEKKLYRELMLKQDPGLMALSLRGFGAGVMPPVCEELHQLHLPLYLVSGQHDDKYVSVMTRMSGLCNDCELQIVEGAGHRVHADRPGKLTEILKTFIETHHHHV